VPLWRFEVNLPVVQGLTGQLTPPDQAFVQKFTVGNVTISDEGEPIANWTKHFPTIATVDTASITMLESGNEGSAWSGLEYWGGWAKVAIDDDGNYGLPGGPGGYWQTITVYSLDIGGNKIAKFEVLEAWPTSIAQFDFDGETSQATYLIVTLACTKVKFTPLRAGSTR
jgi:hypothetical protein